MRARVEGRWLPSVTRFWARFRACRVGAWQLSGFGIATAAHIDQSGALSARPRGILSGRRAGRGGRGLVDPGAQALAWFESGRLAEAADAARPRIRRRGGWDWLLLSFFD
jgi:hypothetical protein